MVGGGATGRDEEKAGRGEDDTTSVDCREAVASAAAAPSAAGLSSQQRLVQAAVDLALEHYDRGTGLRDVFAYLTPSAIADRAGLSRGLIYHYWGDSYSDSSDAVAKFLVAVCDEMWARSAVPEDLADMADLMPGNLSDIILSLTTFELDRVTGSDRSLMQASQALTVHGAWPAGEAERIVERMGALYERLGQRLGLEPIPPLTYEDVAFSIMCLLEGFGLYQHVSPERVQREYEWTPRVEPEESKDPWTLMAILVESALTNMTRPVADPDDGN